MTNFSGHQIGNYYLEKEIKRGGMAVVYKGVDTVNKRPAAIKLMRSEFREETEFIKRFKREARAAARLRHPHIARGYDSGFLSDSGQLFLVMELLEGGSLAELLERRGGSLAPKEAARILRQIAAALDYAHRQGVVHRDIKPSNILLRKNGEAVLADFGIAKAAQDSHLTLSGASLGTPVYMAPEQIMDQGVSPATDIYALGITLYQMLCGRAPFRGRLSAVMQAHVKKTPPPLQNFKPNLSPELNRVTQRALAKSPSDRYPNAQAFARAFDAALGIKAPVTKPQPVKTAPSSPDATLISVAPPAKAPAGRPTKRNRLLLSLAGGALALACLLGAVTLLVKNRTKESAQTPAAVLLQTPLPASPSDAVGTARLSTAQAQGRATAPLKTRDVVAQPVQTADKVYALKAQSPRVGAVYTTAAPAQLQWTGPKLRQNQRYSLALRNTAGGEVIAPSGSWHTRSQTYPLPQLPPGSYVWFVLLEEKQDDRWVTVARSATADFTLTAAPAETVSPGATPVPATGAAQQPALRGKLAFSLRQETQYKVYLLDMGGGQPQILSGINNARQPSIDYSGQWLLINGTGGGQDAITKMRLNGSEAQAATCPQTTAESGRPAWSPDGTRFAFDGLDADTANPQIYLQQIGKMDCSIIGQPLTVNGGKAVDPNGLYPLWGSDNRIYFRSCATWQPDQASTCGIWAVNPDGGDVEQLSSNPAHLPTDVNARRLLFMSNQESNWEIYRLDLSNRKITNLSAHPGADVWGTFSPDGNRIAFVSNRDGNWAIWLMDSSGGIPKKWFEFDLSLGEVDPDQLFAERMSWR